MGKNAYLIEAHRDDLCLRTLLKMIDDERNDIFLHMDKKNKMYSEDISKVILKLKLFFAERINVTWGVQPN